MNDFRSAAAEASNRVLETSRLVNVLDSPASLCLRIDGAGSGPLYRIALVPWIFALFALLIVLAGIIVGCSS